MLYNGVYTMENEKGEHRTFRIRTQPEDANFAPGERIVSLLTGPDNVYDYQGFGFLKADGSIILWKKYRNHTFEYYRELLYTLSLYIEQSDIEEVEAEIEYRGRSYKVMVSKRCIRCNRELTTPESIRAGIGPVCAEKMAS